MSVSTINPHLHRIVAAQPYPPFFATDHSAFFARRHDGQAHLYGFPSL